LSADCCYKLKGARPRLTRQALETFMTFAPAKFLTTRQLARLWLVSEATIKRWADTGQLTSSRTVGGHRRFPVAEVMRFQAERGLGASATDIS
jgi:excisionase family DNA binding protein